MSFALKIIITTISFVLSAKSDIIQIFWMASVNNVLKIVIVVFNQMLIIMMIGNGELYLSSILF